MTPALEIEPGLAVRGFTPPLSLGEYKLLAFGMGSAFLYPGTEELVSACRAAGMAINTDVGETDDSAEKLNLLLAACSSLGISPAQAVVVGRAERDLEILSVAGLSVAFMASPAVASQAMVELSSEGSMDQILKVVSLAVAVGPVVLDLSVLEALVNHDATKFRKFALLFISSIDTVLTEVDAAIAQNNLPLLVAMGHRAKSTARNIGAEAFANQCALLESLGRAQYEYAALQVARDMRPAFEIIRLAIEQRLASSA